MGTSTFKHGYVEMKDLRIKKGPKGTLVNIQNLKNKVFNFP